MAIKIKDITIEEEQRSVPFPFYPGDTKPYYKVVSGNKTLMECGWGDDGKAKAESIITFYKEWLR